MPAGFYVENDHGTVLIDDTYTNVCLLSKGSQSSPPSVGSGEFIARQYDSNVQGSPYRWWRFGKPGTPSTYGLLIYNTAGEVTFDSGKKYARVVDVVAGPLSYNGVITKTYTSGRTYAVVTARGGFAEQLITKPAGQGFPSTWVYWKYQLRITRAWVTSNTVRFGWTPSPDPEEGPLWMGPGIGGPRPERFSAAATYIVLDVTGY